MGGVGPLVRWLVAGLTTIAGFAVTAWICGALVLPMVLQDGGARWGVAGGLGAAVAALAALWGQSFATAGEPGEGARPGGAAASTTTTTAIRPGDTRNTISGGSFHGPVIQGRDISGPGVGGGIEPRVTDPDRQD
jgi:hypothetical protein